MQHIDWALDEFKPRFQPSIGMRIFIDATPELYQERVERSVQTWWDHGDLSEQFDSVEVAVEKFMEQFKPGQPMLITVKETLTTQPPWRAVKLRFA